MSSPAPALSNAALELKALLVEEIKANTSRADWKGHGVPVKFTQFSLTAKMRADVNAIGQEFGCHTCPARLEIDRDQPWVGDHFPPTELALHARKALAELLDDKLFLGSTQLLFPQCQECSNRQAGIVRRLNLMTYAAIVEWLKGDDDELIDVQMLTSGVSAVKKGRTCITSTGPKVTSNEGIRIQTIGSTLGCHSDPSHL